MHKQFPIMRKGRFYNHQTEQKTGVLLPSLAMLIKSCFSRNKSKDQSSAWIEKSVIVARSIEPLITWIGHATFLIQIGGINILTDPVFGKLGPLFPRISHPGITLAQLPHIDFVLISHNHRDHMEASTLNWLKKKYPNCGFLVPQGDKQWFRKRNFERVMESMWWDKHRFTASYDGLTRIEFTFLPAYHWSQRGFFDYNKSLWGSWMITCQNTSIYFAGDTAYSQHFSNIAQEFPVINIALMPIGPCEPRVWMKHSHMSAEDSGQAFLDLKAHTFIPMHWGTYYFGVDFFSLPLDRLYVWWKEQQALASHQKLHPLKIGQAFKTIIE